MISLGGPGGAILLLCLGAATRVASRSDRPGPVVTVTPGGPVPSDSVRLSVQAPATARPGSPIEFTLVVSNQLERRLTLYLRGREIAFDLIVRSGDGTERWRRLANRPIPAIVKVQELGPRASLTLRATWDQRDGRGRPVEPGAYRVYGELLTDREPLRSEAIELTIR